MKPSTNKSFRKLRAVSMVCSLTSGWQQWVAENEKKQGSEPSGWAPSTNDQPGEPKKKWAPKKPHSTQTQPNLETLSETRTSPSQGAPSNDGVQAANGQPSCIKTKLVVKTVSSGVQEKSTGLKRESLPSGDEIDRLLKKRSSPTRRRKCSNMVSSLTKSWKQVESEKSQGLLVEHCFIILVSFFCSCLSITESNVAPRYKKEAEDANKIKAVSKKHSAVGNLKSRWQDWAVEHTVNQKLNPFSEYFDYDYSMSLRLQKGEEGYGRPKEGTKTAERAKQAEQHIHREIDDMCYVIRTMADPDPDGKTRVTFGQLFDRYVRISDKVVGILMRARKHGKVAFEGEMLWQGQDDGVIITLMV
uniref:Actin-binding Rho-activating protein n=1 Tax=Poecilia reticulata TaxID=8081 RepID=A0A3P9PBT0_POERE